MTALLEARNLVVRLGGRAILDGLSLEVPKGELVAIVGPNGSGKSTALRVLAGALKADGGDVLYEGQPTRGLSALDRARFIAYLPQDFASHWDLTVAELLRLGASRGDGFGWMAALHRTAFLPGELARGYELEGLLDRRISTLSGGERARAAVAATVAGNPRLVLADEPAASLDIAHQLRTMRRFTAMKAQTGAVVAVHDLSLAGRFADRIVVVQNGKAVLTGSAAEVLQSTVLDEVFETAFDRRQVDWGVLLVPR